MVASDVRDGLPTSGDESAGGDAGAAVLVGDGPGVLAELVSTASATDEFTDRWRSPGDRVSKLWEERFGENNYLALGQEALGRGPGRGRPRGGRGRTAGRDRHARARRVGPDQEAGARRRGRGRRPDLERGPERHGPPTTRPRLRPRVHGGRRGAGGHAGGRAAPGRRRRRRGPAHDRGPGGLAPGPARGRPGGQRRPDPLRQVPVLAGPAAARAAPAPGAGPGVEHGRTPQRGVEVRVRRVEGPQLGSRPPAALAGLHGGRGRRRHGARAPWPTPRARS